MGLGINNGKALLPPSPSVPHAGALDAPGQVHLASSITPGFSCLVIASPALPTPAELNRESSVWLTVIWECLLRSGDVFKVCIRRCIKSHGCIQRGKAQILIYTFQSFYLPYLVPSRCIPEVQWSIPCVFSTPVGQWVLLHKKSSAMKLETQILQSSHEYFCSVHFTSCWGSVAVPCVCFPGLCFIWLWLRAACTMHRPSLSVLHANCVTGWWSHPSGKTQAFLFLHRKQTAAHKMLCSCIS